MFFILTVEESECGSIVWTFSTGGTTHINDDSDTSRWGQEANQTARPSLAISTCCWRVGKLPPQRSIRVYVYGLIFATNPKQEPVILN